MPPLSFFKVSICCSFDILSDGKSSWTDIFSPEKKRLECELPETPDRYQDNVSTWSDANAAIPSIEERLVSLERGMGEMMHMMRQMMNKSPRTSPSRHGSRNNSIDEAASNDNTSGPHITLKPVQFIRDLQLECFGERNQFSSETEVMGDVVSQGIVDAKLSLKLIEL